MRRLALCLMVALVGCGAPPTANPPTARPSEPSASAEGSAAPKVPPPIVRTQTAPAIPRNDLAARIHVLTTGWRPAVQTAVVAVTEGQTSTLVAVPVAGGGPAVPLVELTNAYSWNLRQDGGALAASVRNGSDSSRIVVWDVLSDSARWLTDDQPGVFDDGPVWTPDGSAVYYGEHSATATTYTDRGIFRINLDGGLPVLVHGPDGNGGSPVRLTPDGRWLIWTRSQAGGSTDVLDLTTGENKSFDITGTSGEIAWRAARPRALVMSGGCCAGRPGGQLILWDDISGESHEIIGSNAAPLVFTGAADWDPTGTLIAAAVFERTMVPRSVLDGPVFIALFDSTGTLKSKVAGSEGFYVAAWLAGGILVRRSTPGVFTEFDVISTTGTDLRVLYRTTAPTVGLVAIVAL